jgi:UDP-glucose 4-epimerase
MSVLVTGGAGYIGSHMVLALLDAGEDVLVVDNLSTGHQWAVPDGVPLIVGDVGDQALVRRLLKRNPIHAIIHFAGSIVVPDSVTDPLGYYLNNTCKSRTLIVCAVEAEVPHFIFSSTAAVYGMPEQNPVAEDARLQPISPYGSSKLMTGTKLRDTAHAIRCATSRCATSMSRAPTRSAAAGSPRRGPPTSSRLPPRQHLASVPTSMFLAPTTRPRTGLACVTTSM